ncbi:MAG TPA: HD domain-containing protein [Candidatus Paceibacterota bacterium]|nr:HD domain-containing protein [Candidatus Paceibacterota bacterium]
MLKSLDYSAKENYSLEVRLAALLHDIGKPQTKQGEGVNATFLNHEIASAKMAKHILNRLHFPNYILDKVVLLVRYHMFFYDPEISTDASLRRLLVKVGKDNIEDLAKLREADRIGSGCPKALPFRLRHFMFRIEKILKDLQGETPSLKMLKVNGNDLMKNIDIEPGPKLGFILNILLEEVLDDISKNTKEYLLQKAKELNNKDIQELKELSEKARDRYNQILNEEEAEIKRKYYV